MTKKTIKKRKVTRKKNTQDYLIDIALMKKISERVIKEDMRLLKELSKH